MTETLVPLMLEQWLQVATYLPFEKSFTALISICKRSRIIILKRYSNFLDRKIVIDLSATTKLLKKMPKHISARIQKMKVLLRSDARLERI
jgi:hypothetical protein